MSRESAMAVATGTTTPDAVVAAGVESATAVESTKDELVSTRIAHIAKFEAKKREEQEALKRDREEFNKSKSEFDPFYAKYKEFEAMRAKDPVAAIKMLGFSDTDYVNFVAAQEDKSTPEEKAAKVADAKIAEFKAEQAKKEKEAEAKRDQEAQDEFRKDIGTTIKADPEQFELCNYYGEAAEALIFKTIQQGYEEDLKTNPEAKPMSLEDAAKLVEGYYEDFHVEANKLKKFNKTAEAPKEEPVAKKEEPLKAEVKPGMPPRTLTNRVAPTAAAASPAAKKESPAEKRARLERWLATGVKS